MVVRRLTCRYCRPSIVDFGVDLRRRSTLSKSQYSQTLRLNTQSMISLSPKTLTYEHFCTELEETSPAAVRPSFPSPKYMSCYKTLRPIRTLLELPSGCSKINLPAKA